MLFPPITFFSFFAKTLNSIVPPPLSSINTQAYPRLPSSTYLLIYTG
nr:MAG TPA: hypothetical protein [Caudoviricetes sp.]